MPRGGETSDAERNEAPAARKEDSRTKVAGNSNSPRPQVVLMARHEGPTGVGEGGIGEKRGSPGTWRFGRFRVVGESDESGTVEPRATEAKREERREVGAPQ